MRNDSQIETREIDDTELDGVSGGLNVGLNLAPVTGVDPSITAPISSVLAPVSNIGATVGGLVSNL